MNKTCIGRLCLLTAATCGSLCGCAVNHVSERECPTISGHTTSSYAGGDSYACSCCGPGDEFYGHKPTCWRTWPTSAEEWRDAYCGPMMAGATISDGEMLPMQAAGIPYDGSHFVTPQFATPQIMAPMPAYGAPTRPYRAPMPEFVEPTVPSEAPRPDFSQVSPPIRRPSVAVAEPPQADRRRLRDTILAAAQELDDLEDADTGFSPGESVDVVR